jgi:DNA-binding transcriptional ArsR family regulator
VVEHVKSRSLDRTYAALADPTRRDILDRLRGGPVRVTDVAARFPMTLNAVSKHIKVLEDAGLISREVRGREHLLWLNAAPMAKAGAWIAGYQQFWEERADALVAHVEAKARAKRAGTKAAAR